jgi:hypothetical protein
MDHMDWRAKLEEAERDIVQAMGRAGTDEAVWQHHMRRSRSRLRLLVRQLEDEADALEQLGLVVVPGEIRRLAERLNDLEASTVDIEAPLPNGKGPEPEGPGPDR